MIDTKLASLVKANSDVRGLKTDNGYIWLLGGNLAIKVKHLIALPKLLGKLLTIGAADDHNEPVKVWNNAAKLFGISVKNLTKVSDTGITVNVLNPYDNKYYDVGLWSNDKTVTSVQRKYTAAFDEGEAAYVDLNNDKWPYTLYFVRKSEIIGVITPYRLDFADVVKNTLPSIVNRLKEGVDNVST